MTNQPLVSIIIPTYNRADLIGETLDSIIEQTYQNWECIVVDDGSIDDTANVLSRYQVLEKRIKYFDRPIELPKSGNSCRNYGLELSQGELIVFFDSDDIMLSDFLSSRIDLFNYDIKIVFATYTTVDSQLNFLKQNSFSTSGPLIKDYIFWNFPILTHSALIKKEFLENKQLFDPKIKRGQETDFYLNILAEIENHQYLIVEKPTFLYRLHDKTISSGAKSYNPDYIPSTIKVRLKALQIGININDKELVHNSYLHLILLLFQIIKNTDFVNYKIFHTNFKKVSIITFFQKIEIQSVSLMLVLIGLTPKKFEYRWINFINKN